jgi:hypothetical protein
MSQRMTLRMKDGETLVLSGLDEFLCGLLREIPGAGVPSAASRERFFPKPTAGCHPEADEDWQDFIEPELEDRFSQNRSRVSEDLRGLQDRGRAGWELEIPMGHVGQWIHALNQARLALTCVNGLGDRELDEDVPPPGPRGVLLFQIRFYGLLQEWMLSLSDELG